MINATIKTMRKGMLLVFAVLLSFGAVSAQEKGLFFSEYMEGSSNNKAMEIYNPTADTVWLSGYAFPNVSNAPSVIGEFEFWNDFPDTAYIAPGDVYVIAHGSADAAILAEADYTFNFLSNGDDGFALVKGDSAAGSSFTVIDWLGSWDGDPGSGWDVAGVTNGTANHTLVRKPDFTSGNKVALASFGVDEYSSEWIVKDQDDFNFIGSHEVGVEFSIREFNRVRNALEFSQAEIQANYFKDSTKTFTAVVTSYPKSSGLATPVDTDNDGTIDDIGRLHMFITDTAAVSRGRGGMSIQVVESDFELIEGFTRGDVVTFTGRLTFFNSTAQVTVDETPLLVGNVNNDPDLAKYATLLDPWEVTVDKLNTLSEDGTHAVNFANYSKYNGAYVKVTGATVSNVSIGDRPNWAVSNNGSRIYTYDTSLRYRNDRVAYIPSFNYRRGVDPEFVPPSPGSVVDLSGFINIVGDDPDGNVTTGEEAFSINPMEDGVLWLNGTRFLDGDDLGGGFLLNWPNDLTVIGQPPVFSEVSQSDSTVTSTDAVTVSATVVGANDKTISEVMLVYSADGVTDSLDMTASGDVYSATIPAQVNFTAVSFYMLATDSDNLSGRNPIAGSYGYFVQDDVINSIALVQQTGDGKPGASPLLGVGAVPVDITATVTTSFLDDGFITIQDKSALWSGVFVSNTNGMGDLELGDIVRITELEVKEVFDITTIDVLTYEILDSFNEEVDTLAVEALTQDVVANYEPYEGVLVEFFNVKILTNQADGTRDFGEWEFGSFQDGGELDTLEVGEGLRYDDLSSSFDADVNEYLKIGAEFERLVAIGYYSFGNPKMVGNADGTIFDDLTYPYVEFDLLTPDEGATVVVTSDIMPTWEESFDIDDDDVTYEWVLYAAADTSEIIVIPSDNEGIDTTVTLSYATVDGLLASLDVSVGESANFLWNVRISDGYDTLDVSSGYDILTNTFTPLYRTLTLERALETSSEFISGLPTKYGLEQNYPNPFNPTTNINFDLPQTSKVTLQVYDMLGRKVATLLDGEQLNASTHSVRFDASALASGMYIYRIEAGSFVSTRKMMLIK